MGFLPDEICPKVVAATSRSAFLNAAQDGMPSTRLPAYDLSLSGSIWNPNLQYALFLSPSYSTAYLEWAWRWSDSGRFWPILKLFTRGKASICARAQSSTLKPPLAGWQVITLVSGNRCIPLSTGMCKPFIIHLNAFPCECHIILR